MVLIMKWQSIVFIHYYVDQYEFKGIYKLILQATLKLCYLQA